MRQLVGVVAVGAAALLLQGTLATFVPVHLLPDGVFLVVVAAAVVLGGARGLAAAALLGWAMDLLSGALLGQHVLILVLAYGATRVANLQLNLLRALPRATLVAGLSLACDLGHAGLGRWLGGAPAPGLGFLGDALVHAAVNALVAPLALLAVQQVAKLLAREEEGGRRTLRVEPRGGTLQP